MSRYLIIFKKDICIFRGVNYAAKSPSRPLKKECATILESMKVGAR